MNNNISITEIDLENYEEIEKNSEFLFTSRLWIKHLEKETKGKAVVLSIVSTNKRCYFVGIIFKKAGLKMCGSPFEGWSTPYMGFVGIKDFNENEKNAILKKTIKFLKRKKKCLYIQICDWNLDCDFAKKHKYKFEIHETYGLDISRSEEALFSSFKTDVRTNSRNFLKRGAILEIEGPTNSFAKDYYEQLVDVFDKQHLISFYSQEKINCVLESFKDNEQFIFCENVYEPENHKSIATGIFFGYKKRCYFFGAASLRNYQILRPNEYVIWNAIKHWKSRGCTYFDMMGVRKYKEKFVPELVKKPIFFFCSIPGLHLLKKIAKKIILKSRRKV